jgi:hypothetical protein
VYCSGGFTGVEVVQVVVSVCVRVCVRARGSVRYLVRSACEAALVVRYSRVLVA